MRAMARRDDGEAALIEIKAVDRSYPLAGEVGLDPSDLADALAERDGAYGVAADAALLARLDLALGDRIAIGDARFELRAVLVAEPDQLASGIGLGPQVLMTEAALQATGLLRSRVRSPAGSIASRSGREGARAGKRSGDRRFCRTGEENLSGSRVGSAHAQKHLAAVFAKPRSFHPISNSRRVDLPDHRRRRGRQCDSRLRGAQAAGDRDLEVARRDGVHRLRLDVDAGDAGGLPRRRDRRFERRRFALSRRLELWRADSVSACSPSIHPAAIGQGALYGLLTALTFSLGPLGRAHDMPVQAVFRDEIEPRRVRPRPRYIVLTVAAASCLIAAVFSFSSDRRARLDLSRRDARRLRTASPRRIFDHGWGAGNCRMRAMSLCALRSAISIGPAR